MIRFVLAPLVFLVLLTPLVGAQSKPVLEGLSLGMQVEQAKSLLAERSYNVLEYEPNLYISTNAGHAGPEFSTDENGKLCYIAGSRLAIKGHKLDTFEHYTLDQVTTLIGPCESSREQTSEGSTYLCLSYPKDSLGVWLKKRGGHYVVNHFELRNGDSE